MDSRGTTNYACFSARLESFKGRKVIVPTAKNPRATKTFRWPNPDSWSPAPKALAAAGFFFAPEQGSKDRVECFCCKRGLGAWEEGDNPFQEHYDRSEEVCAWAAARCSLERDRKGKNRTWKFASEDRNPAGASRTEARLETFSTWALDGIRGSTCTSKALARAGFVHTPEVGNEDLTTCFYCDRELGGWQSDDDPLEEHRRGSDKCPFLDAYDKSQNKKKRGATRSVSRPASRASVAQSTRHASVISDDDVPPPPTKRPPKSKAPSAQSEAETDLPSDADASRPTAKTKRAPTRAKKEKAPVPQRDSSDGSPDELNISEAEPVRATKAKGKKLSTVPAKGKGKGRAKAAASDSSDAVPAPKRAPTKTPAKSRSKHVPLDDDDEEEEESEDELLMPASRNVTESESERRPRGGARASVSRPPVAGTTKKPAAKGKKAAGPRASSRASSVVSTDDDNDEDGDQEEEGGRSRSRAGRKTITAPPPPPPTDLSASLRRSTRTPKRASKVRNAAGETDVETDIDQMLSAAAARAAAKHRKASMSVSESEAPAPATAKRGALGQSTRGKARDVETDDGESELDAPAPVTKTKIKVKVEPAPKTKASTKKGHQKHASYDSVSLSVAGDVDSASGGDEDMDLNEVTPQPKKSSSSSHHPSSSSGAGARPIAAPNFVGQQQETSTGAVPAPSERPAVNGWRELAQSRSAQGPGPSAGASVKSVIAMLKDTSAPPRSSSEQRTREQSGDRDPHPRLIAPMRKSRTLANGPSQHIKSEPFDEGGSSMPSTPPPRPPRSPERERERAWTGDLEGTPRASSQPSRIPTPKGRGKSAAAAMEVDVPPPVPRARDFAMEQDEAEHAPALVPSHSLGSTASTSSLDSSDALHHHDHADPLDADMAQAMEVITPFIVSASNANPSGPALTEEQLQMTLEEFIRSEAERVRAEMKREGEALLERLAEEGARNRLLIIKHLGLDVPE